MFDESISKDSSSLADVEDLLKECSDYQNQILRRHINKLHLMLRESIFELKRDVCKAKEEIIYGR